MKYMSKVPYASVVGSLMYAMVCTRPDIAHAVGVVSRYMLDPRKEHWEGVKWILRYLKGTSGMTLCSKKSNIILQGFADANLGGELDSRKSTTGYVFTLGGTAVSWMSRLQKSVALSTIEVEYMFVTEKTLCDAPGVKDEYLLCLKHLVDLLSDKKTSSTDRSSKPALQELKDEIKSVEVELSKKGGRRSLTLHERRVYK
ncbi:secreted RxLR effector protein 161-like [Nicotiana tabacum]|uniref:Secreted RxLR effector protein 161-like n=1 Tax=Nicotiana tabacum TaxID=4097 RepID=A0AC58SJK3_TOBAC